MSPLRHLRRRFSLAHEYAHVVVDRDRAGLVSRASDRDDLIEVRANSFAASFLMPEEGVRQFVAGLGKGSPSRTYAEMFDEAGSVDVEGRSEPGSQSVQLYDVVQLAHYFGVSRLAALYRLRNLRLVSAAEFEQLSLSDARCLPLIPMTLQSTRGRCIDASIARLSTLAKPISSAAVTGIGSPLIS